METHTPTTTPEFPKSASFMRHRVQRFWQIIAPVGFGILVILVLLALVIRTAVLSEAGGSVSQWADTSLIWLSLPAVLFALALALVLVVMIYLVARLLQVLPGFTFKVQHYTGLIAGSVGSLANKLVAPIIAFRGTAASASALIGALFGRRRD